MAALEIDFTVLSLPLEMGRTSNRARDEFQNDTLGLLLNEKKKNGMIMSENSFTVESVSRFPEYGLNWWISNLCTPESSQETTWLVMTT